MFLTELQVVELFKLNLNTVNCDAILKNNNLTTMNILMQLGYF